MARHQSLSGDLGEENNLFSLPGLEPRIVYLVAQSVS